MKAGRTMVKFRNLFCAVLCILAVAALGYLVYTSRQQEKELTASLNALQAEAKTYESELADLRLELNSLPDTFSYSSEEAEIMVGFNVTSAEDIAYIEEKSETNDFSPVLVIDCTMETEDIETIVEAADADWEIMLYATDFSEAANDDVLKVLSWMESIEREQTGVFLLRDAYSSESNMQLLADDGFIGYTSYHDSSPQIGQTEDGYVYFDYSYLISSETVINDRLSALYSSKASMIVVFDMFSINSGSVSKSYVTSLLNTMQGYAKQEDCSFSTVADVVEELSGINEIEAENQEEYEEQAAEIQERIDELEETISNIYDQLEEE